MNAPIILATPVERAAERAADTGYRDFVIAEVEDDNGTDATVTVVGSWTTTMPWGIEPRPAPGMRIRVWSRGTMNHGVSLWQGEDLVPVYYKTQREQEIEHAAWIAEHQREQRERHEAARPWLDEQYALLPPALQRRLDRFRAADPDFRWKEEGYEMAACAEAGRLYRAALDPATGIVLKANGIKLPLDSSIPSYEQPKGKGITDWESTPENRLMAIDAINGAPNDYNYPLLHELFPWIDEGHSGNTWAHAVAFARELVRRGDEAQL